MIGRPATSTVLAIGRIAYGAALAVAPRRAAGAWLGRHADDPGAQVALRGLGARDLALGAGALVALRARGRRGAAVWMAAQAAADATDLVSTLLARRHLPRRGVRAAVAIAGAAAALDVAEAVALARGAKHGPAA
jgi:hypothetical protein